MIQTSRSLLLVAVLLWTQPSISRSADTVQVGAGSYLTKAPKLCKPLPSTIYKTKDVTGPMVTNQWWSSLVWQKFSQNLFAHPAVVRCDADGLMMAYPGSKIHGNPTGIFGDADLRKGDLKIGHSEVKEFPQADCAGYSDWFVTASFAKDQATLQASFGHGSPFVYCMYKGGLPLVSFTKAPKVWGKVAKDAILGVTVNGHHYGLFGATDSTWSGLEGTTFKNQSNQAHFAVAVLPDDKIETLQLFAKHAYAHVTDTRVEYEVKDGLIHTTYQFICTPREGEESSTIFALYPHQWKYSSTELTKAKFGSVRGEMKIGLGNKFETAVPVQGVLPMLPREGIPDRSRMIGYLQEELNKPAAGFGDSYWEGKHLGLLASLSGIAEVADAPKEKQIAVTEMKRRLESWFTAKAGKEQPVFYYDANWGTLVGSRPGYGSDSPLNDHHFHYGYFIRAAAEVARIDPKWAEAWGPMVNLVIRDIASSDRKDSMFPFLRCFDKYAGHSWASGDANFADGNNQESSSESLNAWYGLMLWGEATGDVKIRDLGVFLFNTERTAVEEYWFDVAGTNYPADFPNVALGMVWGGKGAFGTWFSGDIDCIHGINWLPFTPASIYMGRYPEYVKKNHDRIVAKRKGGLDYSTGWGDLVVMFNALQDPASAAKYLNDHPKCKIEGGNSHAFMYHWMNTLNNLGTIDARTTCSYPFSNIYIKDSKKSYSAYNYGNKPLKVIFSDGVYLEVPPHALLTKTTAKD
jgi:endoglucanase Acf2